MVTITTDTLGPDHVETGPDDPAVWLPRNLPSRDLVLEVIYYYTILVLTTYLVSVVA